LTVYGPLPLRGGDVQSAVFNPDGNLVVTAGPGPAAIVWDWQRATKVRRLDHPALVNDAAFGSTGELLVTAGADGWARVWNWRTRGVVAKLGPHPAEVGRAALSPDDTLVVTVGRPRGIVRIWNVATGSLVADLHRLARSPALDAAFSSDGEYLVTSGADTVARVWAWRSRQIVSRLGGHPGQVSSATFSPDDEIVVTTSQDGARLWDWRSSGADAVRRLPEPKAAVDASFSSDGKFMVTANEDGVARIYGPAQGPR